MALKGALIWLCLLSVLSFSASQDSTIPQSCSADVLEQLSSNLKVTAECSDNLPFTLSAHQTASLLLSMRNLTGILHKQQLSDCEGAEPKNCSAAEVPDNGGLACVSVNNKRYCKPLCNYGYDFGFIRRGRVYDECSEQTRYKWSTQYIGGNKLAVCNESPFQISGVPSAYFPRDQDCLTTKGNIKRQKSIIQQFTTELISQGIDGTPQFECLVCGGL
ncbi:uncharacterized protein si:ch1073-126c3.2 [Cheilinus undulatus]|uniref:uncharacterized protein si:ch1073-126c3.2 n=1 Tax=Cheilinus undulatus TaxID=241271 RepID=UPI001BD2AD3D|nr:uncharacterized protein si:ch1073-126c3.2 [Cheilinus undulatus]